MKVCALERRYNILLQQRIRLLNSDTVMETRLWSTTSSLWTIFLALALSSMQGPSPGATTLGVPNRCAYWLRS
jgi:hypothetical protein